MKDGRLKRFLLKALYRFQDMKQLYYIRKHYGLSIMTAEETLAYIKTNRCSVARYGDGEFSIMLQRGAPVFQSGNQNLAQDLLRVFENTSDELLICLPHAMVSTKGFEPWAKQFWEGWARKHQSTVVQAIRDTTKATYHFGDSYISRPYTAYTSKEYARKMFDGIMLGQNKTSGFCC